MKTNSRTPFGLKIKSKDHGKCYSTLCKNVNKKKQTGFAEEKKNPGWKTSPLLPLPSPLPHKNQMGYPHNIFGGCF